MARRPRVVTPRQPRTSLRGPWEPPAELREVQGPIRYLEPKDAEWRGLARRTRQQVLPVLQLSVNAREWIVHATISESPRWLHLDAAACMQCDISGARIPMAVGLSDEGWFPVVEAILADMPAPSFAKASAKPLPGIMLRLGDGYGLPPRVHLSEYDGGHEIVATTGPWLGRSGVVQWPTDVNTLLVDDGEPFEVGVEEVAVVCPNGPSEDLLPLSLRLPVDAKAWAVLDGKAHRVVVGERVRKGTLVEVWSLEEQKLATVPRSRHLLAERVPGQPCPLTAPVPKNRKVPPSKRGRREPQLDHGTVQASLDAVDHYLWNNPGNPGGATAPNRVPNPPPKGP